MMYGDYVYGNNVYADYGRFIVISAPDGGSGESVGTFGSTPGRGVQVPSARTGRVSTPGSVKPQPSTSFPSSPRRASVPGVFRQKPGRSFTSTPPRPAPSIRTAIAYASTGRAFNNPSEFSDEWLYGLDREPRFILRLEDQYVYTQWPSALSETETMYLKSQVAFTGTEASPETFTTNSGKLATMDTGEAYPTFDDADWVFHVSINGAKYQEANLSIVKDSVQVVAGNLQFQAYVGMQGNAATDGNYYGDVAIILQARP